MLTENQRLVFGVWVGGPFVLLLVLMLINPNYERRLFVNFMGCYGMNFVIVLQALNALFLFMGFSRANHHAERAVGEHRTRSGGFVLFVSILTLVLFIFPTLWIVLLWPSLVILAQEKIP